MRKQYILILLTALLALTLPSACTDEIIVQSGSEYETLVALTAMLTDRPDHPQCIYISETIPYFDDNESPKVRGASVQVNDVVFTEKEAGVYVAPDGYCCHPGQEYHLKVRLPDGREITSEATMPEPGFEMDGIDYAYLGGLEMDLDSTWAIGIWGLEKDFYSNYFVNYSVNGYVLPLYLSLVTIDYYFNGNVIKGFPIMYMLQRKAFQKEYDDCFKYLETGDVITLNVYTIDEAFYKYLISLTMDALYIPLISPQPSNAPCNLHGEKVVGYFTLCPHADASVVVEDPLRDYFKKSLPF